MGDKLFTKPEKPFMLLQVLKGDLCVDWFDDEDEMIEHANYYKTSYGNEYEVRDAIEIGSCRTIEL